MALNRIKNPSIDSGFWDNHRERTANIVDAVLRRRRRNQLQMDWGWTQIGVAFVPWCPECGAVCAVGAGQLAHEQNVHGTGQASDTETELYEPDSGGESAPGIE